MSVEIDIHPNKGLIPKNTHLIKLAKCCLICKHSYLWRPHLVSHNSYKVEMACHIHNCKIDSNEWCKHHTTKETK